MIYIYRQIVATKNLQRMTENLFKAGLVLCALYFRIINDKKKKIEKKPKEIFSGKQ